MIPANEIVIGARAILNEGCGYIFSTSGQIWTQEDQDAVESGAKKTGSSAQTEKTKEYGDKWIGKRVFDCSGLWYYLMMRQGAYIFHGSNTIWKDFTTKRGEITPTTELKPGTAVFLYRKSDDNRHHIGIYVGDGKCIEAKGTYYGVVESKLSHWDEWGEIKGIDYGGGDMSYPILKRGCSGVEVKTLQALLNGWGYSLDVDGSFGKKTEDAVKDFQKKNGLTADGIVGEKTWAALTSDAPDDPDDDDPDTVQITLKRSTAQELADALKVAGIG